MKTGGLVQEAAKAMPPVGITGLHIAGVPLSEWVLILTAVYTSLLIVHKSVDVVRSLRVARPCGQKDCKARRRSTDWNAP